MRILAVKETSHQGVGSAAPDVRLRLAYIWGLGVASLLIYVLAFARRYPLLDLYRQETLWGGVMGFDRFSGALYLAAVTALFALFALAVWAVRGVPYREARWPIYGFALAFGLATLLMYPGGSIDLFVYVAFSRVWVHFGANPLVVAAATYPQDPLAALAGPWAHVASPYGPFWTLLSSLASLLGRDDLLRNLLVLKCLALASYLGVAAVISWIVARIRPADRALATLLFAWNPVVVLETTGNGHNDAAMMFLVLLAFALALSGRWRVAAVGVLVLACLVKYTVALLLPVLFLYCLLTLPTWRERARFTAFSTLLAAAIVAVLFAPFWEGRRTFDAVLLQNTFTVTTPVWILDFLVERHLPWLEAAGLPQKAFFAAFGLLYLYQLIRLLRRPSAWASVAFESILWSLYAVGKFYPWYAVWPLALGVLNPTRRTVIWLGTFTYGVLLWSFVMDISGFVVGWPTGTPDDLFRNELLVVVAVFVVPALVRVGLWLAARRHAQRPRETVDERAIPLAADAGLAD